ncbi:hypothetical protein Tco_0620521 [Tanacetum coccineum]
MRRWLTALKETEKLSGGSLEDDEKNQELHLPSDELNDNMKKPSPVMYYDSDMVGDPMNFRDVFLYSQALEGITISIVTTLVITYPYDISLALHELNGFDFAPRM